ncbi:MAG: hypothetical protein MUC42_17760 [Bryobacter sp.]|nr:hypothetical protein [Bryobacter sp.]
MLSRRRLLAAFATPAGARHAVCRLDGTVLDLTPAPSALPPGSVLKPLYAGLLDASVRFRCGRKLTVESHRLDCTHAPLLGPIDLETALAASCNSWFAQSARRLDPSALVQRIRAQGGEVNAPATRDQLVLTALGIQGVRFTPLAIARAYARLRAEAAPAVLRGLSLALESGTAAPARGPYLAGKTGTVHEGGWFAGWTGRVAVAVFIPGGNGGADAAPAALRLAQIWHSQPAA